MPATIPVASHVQLARLPLAMRTPPRRAVPRPTPVATALNATAVRTVVGGSVAARSRLYFVPGDEMRLPRADILSDVLGEKDGVWILRFTSSVLARDVHVSVDGVEGTLSRDRFDLLPGEIQTLTFTTDAALDEAELLGRLRITSLESRLAVGR